MKTTKDLISKNPATNEPIWTGSLADDTVIAQAVSVATRAQQTWEATPLDVRKDIIRAFADQVTTHSEDAARIISEDNGKPLWEARTEVKSLGNKVQAVFDAYDQRAQTVTKQVNGRQSVTRYRPHGVMAVLGPYNFPMSMPNSHVMPALLAGNTVIFKPSEKVPYAGEYYVQLWQQAGLPDGVLQVIHGDGDIAQKLIAHPQVNGVLFIGSRAAGVSIEKQLAGAPDKICALEMGGNSPLVIWDYDDVRLAVHIALQSGYISSGQRCSSARRLIVNKAVADEFIPALRQAVESIVVGCQFDTNPTPFMGPLVDHEAVRHFFDKYHAAVSAGAHVLVPAEPITMLGDNFVSPGLIDVTGVSLPDEEIFGPLLQVSTVQTLAEAITQANATQFGLAAGIVTRERAQYEAFYQQTKAGIINWNQPLTGATTAAPFGGAKASGNYRSAGFLSVDYCSYPCASIEDEAPTVPSTLPVGVTY